MKRPSVNASGNSPAGPTVGGTILSAVMERQAHRTARPLPDTWSIPAPARNADQR